MKGIITYLIFIFKYFRTKEDFGEISLGVQNFAHKYGRSEDESLRVRELYFLIIRILLAVLRT